MRYFSIEEAQALIPRMEEVFREALDIYARAESKARRVSELESSDKAPPHELALERGQLQFLVNTVNERLKEIFDLGAVPKGLEPALVDFPFRLGGQEVHLCWKLGEKRITHYHGLEEGFAGRKALPSSAARPA